MPTLIAYGLPEQIACVEREIALRKRVYPRWVSMGRLTQEKADRETETMEAVLGTLRARRDGGHG